MYFTPTLITTTILASQPSRKIQTSDSRGSNHYDDDDDDDDDNQDPFPVWAKIALIVGCIGLIITVCFIG